MNFSVEDRGQGILVYVQEFGVWRQATPSECAKALADAIEAEREACAKIADEESASDHMGHSERIADAIRNRT